MNYQEPSISDLLIATLFSNRNVKTFRSILNEQKFKKYKKESVRVSLSRLNKKGYLENSNKKWSVTQKGIIYAEKINLHSYIISPFEKDSPENTIISFDIPGPQRSMRDWLRNQIKIFNYKMLHQSLWLGPGPLPDTFLKRLEELKIRKNVKIFTIKKKEI
jgi:DNA-binding transcriptional regulator PaaX